MVDPDGFDGDDDASELNAIPSPLHDLSTDTLLHIVTFLPSAAFIALLRTSRHLHSELNSDAGWRAASDPLLRAASRGTASREYLRYGVVRTHTAHRVAAALAKERAATAALAVAHIRSSNRGVLAPPAKVGLSILKDVATCPSIVTSGVSIIVRGMQYVPALPDPPDLPSSSRDALVALANERRPEVVQDTLVTLMRNAPPPVVVPPSPHGHALLGLLHTGRWDATLLGPEGTPYAGGLFRVVIVGHDMPFGQMFFRFETPVWHPLLPSPPPDGAPSEEVPFARFCDPSPAMRVHKLALALCSVLSWPAADSVDDARVEYKGCTLNPEAWAQLCEGDGESFLVAARACTRQHAFGSAADPQCPVPPSSAVAEYVAQRST